MHNSIIIILVSESTPFVSVAEMATMLRVEADRVPLLVKLGYLRYHEGDESKIALPKRTSIRWLRLMLLPLPNRPLFTLQEVAKMSEIIPARKGGGWQGEGIKLIRKLCATYAIPIYADEQFGELMSPDSFIQLLDALFGYREPMRFDRTALVEWMRGLKTNRRLRYNLPYSKLLESEIGRIVRLNDPERTMRAVALWEAYRDAKLVSTCIAKYKSSVKHEMKVVEGKLTYMMRSVTGQVILPPKFPEGE
jgi:hypothetical protein